MNSAHLILTPPIQPGDLPAGTPAVATFDELSSRLAAWPRLLFEPDGAFVWVGGPDEPAWQLDGQVYDGRAGIAAVEIKGNCPPWRFQELLAALGGAAECWTLRDGQRGEALSLEQAQRQLSPG
jgi:hypothetical protein